MMKIIYPAILIAALVTGEVTALAQTALTPAVNHEIAISPQPTNWLVTAILEAEGGTNVCCFINTKEFKTVTLKTGESKEGITLVSVDYTNECVVVKVGTNEATLALLHCRPFLCK